MVNPFETIDARLSNIEALLLDLFSCRFSQGPNDTAAEKLMTVSEAAELLTLAVPTIYALVQRREIPFSRRGKRLYFSKSELTEWVQAGRIKTACEVVAEAEAELATAGRRGGTK